MKPHKYYAHSKYNAPVEEWQELEEHLLNVATLAAEFANKFDSFDWAWNSGYLHDLGKACDAFQAYLKRSNGLDDTEYDGINKGRINHSTAGAVFAEKKLGPCIGRILAYSIAGHHAGLPDWFPTDTGRAALQYRLQDSNNDTTDITEYIESIIQRLKGLKRPPQFIQGAEKFHLWIKMLFSCLVDADCLDSETFEDSNKAKQRKGFSSLSDLKKCFNHYMDKMTANAPDTSVNKIRKEILNACRKAAEDNPGLFSLTVPTGGGKTLSSMAFAIDHAIKFGKDRIIYIIPYTSIIEQTANIFSEIFGRENIVEHHSNIDSEKETPRSRLASENWDAPIIVTTNVQFFESLYAAKSSRCRKLHNLVNSVIIMDEAQLLPPKLLTPCIDAMKQLVNNYGVTIMISTATQPALEGLGKPREIIDNPAILYERLKRTNVIFPEDLEKPTNWEDLSEKLESHKQVLCIVNTRRDCYDLYRQLPESTIHLSALMCGRHRSAVIRLIKTRLHKGLPIRVISTQLVEAGVDIDFPVVYRAFSGLTSIAQAAGRCNREGKCSIGEVHVFIPPKRSPPGILLKAENTTRELFSSQRMNLNNPDIFLQYSNLFYSKINDTGNQWLNDRLIKDVNPNLYFQFRTAAKEFNIIDDQAQKPVIVRYGESDKLIDQLRVLGPTREIMRRLQRYTVNLPIRMIEKMSLDGLLEKVNPIKAPDVIAQCNIQIYDKSIGLDIYRKDLPIEDLYI